MSGHQGTVEEVVAGLRAAGEPTRLRLLYILSKAELTVTELTQIMGQSQPRVSQHLKRLTGAGLVERFSEGSWAFYRLAESSRSDMPSLGSLIVDEVDPGDEVVQRDRDRLETVKNIRAQNAAAYFKANAQEWNSLRALHLPEAQVDEAILKLIGDAHYEELIDLGTGTGHVLELLSPHVTHGVGIDASHEMLTVARAHLERCGTNNCVVRQGDIFALPFSDATVDLVTVHQVLHYLDAPGAAIAEAARLLCPGGRLVIVDFAPHDIEFLRTDHAHRRLGFSQDEVENWCRDAGLSVARVQHLPAGDKDKLMVTLWLAEARSSEAILDNKKRGSIQ